MGIMGLTKTFTYVCERCLRTESFNEEKVNWLGNIAIGTTIQGGKYARREVYNLCEPCREELYNQCVKIIDEEMRK